MPKVDLLVVIVGNSGATSALPKVSDIILYVVVLPRFPCWNDANYQFKEPQSSHAFVLRLLEKPFLDEIDSISRNWVDARHGQIKGCNSYDLMQTNSLNRRVVPNLRADSLGWWSLYWINDLNG